MEYKCCYEACEPGEAAARGKISDESCETCVSGKKPLFIK